MDSTTHYPRLILSLIIAHMLLLIGGELAAEDTTPTTAPAPMDVVLPADAKQLLTAEADAEARAKATYDAAVAKLRADLIPKLVKAQESATKKGDLNGALAVKAKIGELDPKGKEAGLSRAQADKLKTLSAGDWKELSGQMVKLDALKVNKIKLPAGDYFVAPNPADLWNGGPGPIDYHGKSSVVYAGMPAYCLVMNDGTDKQLSPGVYHLENEISFRMNDRDLSVNSGFINLKIVPVHD